MSSMSKEEAVQWYAQNRGLYKKLSEKIHNIISELLEESNITVHAINNRAKELDSFKKKSFNPKYDNPIDQITDLSGIRIIAYVEDDLKPISQIIRDTFEIDIENSQDKSEELGTDRVGYKSIHFIAKIKNDRLNLPEYKKFGNLKFEIQIRTILQHAWAEIEHDKNYKFNGVLPSEIKRRFKILAGTLELADREFNSLAIEIDKIKIEVQNATNTKTLDTIEISTTTVKELLLEKFNSEVASQKILDNFDNQDTAIIEEIIDYGLTNLNELNLLFDETVVNAINKIILIKKISLTAVLRIALIVNDYKKYFLHSWKNRWVSISKDYIDTFNHVDEDIIKEMTKNGIGII